MTSNLQQHHDRLEQIRRDHWRAYESAAEHEARADTAELDAGSYFDRATAAQREAYRLAIIDLAGLYAPRDDRAREAARAAWYAATAAARSLFEISFDEIMRAGELSEATASRWDRLAAAEYAEMAS
jgi:hypothetical protein